MEVPLMEFVAALSAGVLTALFSRFALPRIAKCACCAGQPPAEPDDVTSDASSAAVISTAAASAHF